MRTVFIFLISVLLIIVLRAQPAEFKELPTPWSYELKLESQILQVNDNTFLMFYTNGYGIKQLKSTDGGNTWSSSKQIYSNALDTSMGNTNLSAYKTLSGRIFLVFRPGLTSYYFSDDNGETWKTSEKYFIRTGPNNASLYLPSSGSLFQANNSNLIYIFSHNRTRLSYTLSAGADTVWEPYKDIISSFPGKKILEPSLVIQPNDKWICTFRAFDTVYSRYGIYQLSSTDNGVNWSAPLEIITGNIYFQRLAREPSGELYLAYTKLADSAAAGKRYFQNYDIYYRTSTNDGNTWSPELRVTGYPYKDLLFNLNVYGDKINISFTSSRGNLKRSFVSLSGWREYSYSGRIFYGILGVTRDLKYPPVLARERSFGPDSLKHLFAVQAQVISDSSAVTATLYQANGKTINLMLYDDGLHSDSSAGDGIFGGVIGGIINPINPSTLQAGYKVNVTRDSLFFVQGDASYLNFSGIESRRGYVLSINNFQIPVTNNGVLSDYYENNRYVLGSFDSVTILYSGGFYLSGLANGNIWSNGVLSAARIEDYTPGPVREYPSSGSVFVVSATDPAFGKSWQEWRLAVSDGADFYDGDGDGIYNPTDKNLNGLWDSNEDRPDILGDVTAWCVYNDNIAPSSRRFTDVAPMGIEIQQTVFAWAGTGTPLENSFFVRYRIINKSQVYDKFDSVYFSVAADPDIADYNNDRIGCDSLLNLAYAYDAMPDTFFWRVGAAIGTALLQGPPAYLPGITFNDINGDGRYQPGIDLPLDSAFSNRGRYLGINAIPGALNRKMDSFQPIFRSTPLWGDPGTKEEMRNYLFGGISRSGVAFDPCSFPFSTIYPPAACSTLNPRFSFSGEPVAQTGWVCTSSTDIRTLLNTGPFTLERNRPVDIIAAYSVARHPSSTIGSVNVLKDNIRYLIGFYNDNFTRPGLPLAGAPVTQKDIVLYDNYPNPFNPVTIIGFKLPYTTEVCLKIYDILGNEILTPVNGVKAAGYHSIEFNASSLASGVYFYHLQAGGIRQIKKMMVIK